MKNNSSHKKRWLIVGGVVLVFILFAVFVDVRAILRLLRRTDWTLWLGGVAFLLAGYGLNTVRWRYLLAGKPGWLSLSYSDSITYMLNMVTPVPIMVSRIVTTGWMTQVSIPQATSGMLVDRLLEMMMRLLAFILVLILVAARSTDANTTATILISLGLFAGAIAGLAWIAKHRESVTNNLATWLGRLPRLNKAQIHSLTDNLLQGLVYAGSTRRLVTGFLISLVMWTCFLGFHYMTIAAPPEPLLFKQTLLIALIVLVVIPPSTPAMIGVYHTIVIGVLVGLRLTDINRAVIYAILLHLPQLAIWLLAGTFAYSQSDVKFNQLLHATKEHAGQLKSDSDIENS